MDNAAFHSAAASFTFNGEKVTFSDSNINAGTTLNFGGGTLALSAGALNIAAEQNLTITVTAAAVYEEKALFSVASAGLFTNNGTIIIDGLAAQTLYKFADSEIAAGTLIDRNSGKTFSVTVDNGVTWIGYGFENDPATTGIVNNGADSITIGDKTYYGTAYNSSAAAFNAGKATVYSSKETVTSLTVDNGETLYACTASATGQTHGGSGAVNNAGTAEFTDSNFTGNSLDSAKTNSVNGGAVANSGVATFNGGSFDGNKALLVRPEAKADNFHSASGGAIYNTNELYVNGTTFTDNEARAQNYAGGSYISVMGSGGAIFNSGTADITGNFTGNKATHDSADYSNSDVATKKHWGFGGAIYNSGTITRLSGNFDSNSATYNGGAIYNNGTVTLIENSTLSKNSSSPATVKSSMNTVANGGAIYNAGTMNIKATDFYENTVSVDTWTRTTQYFTFANGGAVYNSGALTIEDGSLKNNSATASGGNSANDVFSNGGAIYSNGTLELTGKTVLSQNKATRGGAVYIDTDSAAASFTGSIFNSNEASAGGGAIYNNAAQTVQVTITGGSFSNNKSCGGGAVYNCGDMIVEQVTFDSNTANKNSNNGEGNGGAVTNSGTAKLLIKDSVFDGNTSAAAAGAILNGSGSQLILDGSNIFRHNRAAEEGGAIKSSSGILTINGGIFENNTAGFGGAIYLSVSDDADDPAVSITNSKFIANSATDYTASDYESSLSNSKGSGGAVCNTNAQHVTVASSYFIGNTGAENNLYGGAISNANNKGQKAAMTISGSYFLTSSDTIWNKGNLTFTGSNTINADVTNSSGTVTAAGATFTFHDYSSALLNDVLYTKSAITVDGALAGASELVFKGSQGVNFTSSADVAKVTLESSVVLADWFQGSYADNGWSRTIASGADFTGAALTAAGKAVDGDTVTDDFGFTYTVGKESDKLTLTLNNIKQTINATTALTRAEFSAEVAKAGSNEVTVLTGTAGNTLTGDGHKLLLDDYSAAGKYFYGGGVNAEGTGGDVTVIGNLGLGSGRILAGGNYAVADDVTVGDSTLNISNATGTASQILAGGFLNVGTADKIVNVNGGNSTLNYSGTITGCDFVSGGWSVGGKSGFAGTQAEITGDTVVNITGGKVDGAVLGGSFVRNDLMRSFTQNGNSTVNISGGEIGKNVIAGIGIYQSNATKYVETLVSGNTAITIDTSENVVILNYNIFGGSQGIGKVSGGSTVTFTGKGENLVFSTDRNIIISGESSLWNGSERYVAGDRVLKFENFSGTFDAQCVRAFDEVVIENSSADISGVDIWDFCANTGTLNFGDFTNSFAGDKIEVDWEGALGNPDAEFSSSDIFAGNIDGWDNADTSVKLFGLDATFDDTTSKWIACDDDNNAKYQLSGADGKLTVAIYNGN